ncbi:MAG TPA: HD domain-containing protein [bacterium]|nr:HD domain-containing protein [bacterium]
MSFTPGSCYNLLVESIHMHLSPLKQQHSFSVAGLAADLCTRFNVDPAKGRMAGLAHDLAREMSRQDLIMYAGRDGREINDQELKRPVLLHGRAAAVLLRLKQGWTDLEFLQAVEDHVVGRPAMSKLSRIIFVADYLEPNRSFLADEARRRLLAHDLDKMLQMVLRGIFNYLRGEGIPIVRSALDLYKEL